MHGGEALADCLDSHFQQAGLELVPQPAEVPVELLGVRQAAVQRLLGKRHVQLGQTAARQ